MPAGDRNPTSGIFFGCCASARRKGKKTREPNREAFCRASFYNSLIPTGRYILVLDSGSYRKLLY
jgi:hypothetical protein